MINNLNLSALLSSRDAITSPIFTSKKCYSLATKYKKNYIHSLLSLFERTFIYKYIVQNSCLLEKNFYHRILLFIIFGEMKKWEQYKSCYVASEATCDGKVGEICTVQVFGHTLTFLSEVNIRISWNPPISLFHCTPLCIFINSSKQISRKFSILSPTFLV